MKVHTTANLISRLLGILLLGWCCASAQDTPIPMPLQGVTVSTAVTADQAGRFIYSYQVNNPSSNNGKIWHFVVEITQASDGVILNSQGLVNGPRYANQSSQLAAQLVPMVPVAMDGPSHWIYGLTYDNGPPLRGFASWAAIDEAYLISPNRSLDGFSLTSPGLPALRVVRVEPYIDQQNLSQDFLDDPDKIHELQTSLVFQTVTVGPKAPTKNMTNGDFFDYLIGLVNESRSLGWITNDGVQNALLVKLNNAKSSVVAGDRTTGRNILSAFLNDVSGSACQSYSCPGAKPIYSEAYSLLYFNGKFLLNSL